MVKFLKQTWSEVWHWDLNVSQNSWLDSSRSCLARDKFCFWSLIRAASPPQWVSSVSRRALAMVDMVPVPANSRNNNRKHRRKILMRREKNWIRNSTENYLYWRCSSTFHLNESSMDSSVYETPPLARRHSQGLRGSKLNSICLGRRENSQGLSKNISLACRWFGPGGGGGRGGQHKHSPFEDKHNAECL